MPRSFARAQQPPAEFSSGTAENVYVPEDASQMVAPAGTLLMYHAATYHRLHVNRSDRPRIGVLQSFVPNFIAETSEEPARRALAEWLREGDDDRVQGFRRYAASAAFGALSQREHADLDQVWAGGRGTAARL